MNLVLVGGGVAGHLLAHRLAPRPITLVDPRDHLLVPMAAPRFLVDPGVAERALVPFGQFLPHATHVKARAVEARDACLILDDGRSVPFDVLVLALGAAQPDPAMTSAGDRSEQLRTIADRHAALRGASTTLILGGGPVGVETAGELAERGIGGRLVLAHSGDRLLPSASPHVGLAASRYLTARGVDVQLGVRYQPAAGHGPGVAHTSDGVQLAYDAVIRATGGPPATAWLRSAGVLNDAGQIQVDSGFRVRGRPGWYAIGDCNDLPEPKLGRWAAKQGEALARALLRGTEAAYPAHTGHRGMVVTLGAGHAVGEIPGLPAFLVSPLGRWVKGRDLLVGRYRRRVGLR